ncbi:uncharacterized protein LAESUDRAFT_734818 [Laetiporus sulphureus 93-53]|uniref:Uncharacterized protein n=1 Tax=Laetiporus sulphureus 93-53 TaxID=1314785 RepID=A0A165GGX3_9APHY|nr:uncharacterized protein LAESUDRAFT_734818 [Laetiporus sulphureus 93-53]KZT10330.1 hypothetical protein LAESUDRAFT_734818 [Laetiporus sulphureus 93-53]
MYNSTLLSSPSTPPRSSTLRQFSSLPVAHQPLNSSPLASSIPSSPTSSPGAEAYARRRAQYKAHRSSSPTPERTKRSQKQQRRVTLPSSFPVSLTDTATPTEEAPRTTFLRERFRARCLERAQRDRERKIRRRRGQDSSDGDDELMDGGDEEEEEEFMNDELFHRLVSSSKRKQQHQYRLSYAYDVGSSFDPDMENGAEWEHELDEREAEQAQGAHIVRTTPADLDEEELVEYAEYYELHLEDLRPEDLFSVSDVEDYGVSEDADENTSPKGKTKAKEVVQSVQDADVDMDV